MARKCLILSSQIPSKAMVLARFQITGLFLVFISLSLRAQTSQTFLITLPDAQITADRLLRGDGDTYGLGDWRSTFRIELEDIYLKVEGEIIFTEKANDQTTLVGQYQHRFVVGMLEKCRSCSFVLEETEGTIRGPNVGARGYRWYKGRGIVRSAQIVTDTFGDDVGKIGGTVKFRPVKVQMHCYFASTGN